MIAAIYLDAGLAAARDFVKRALLETAIEARRNAPRAYPTTSRRCRSCCRRAALPPARYRVVREAGPDHQKTFWIEVGVAGLVTATGSGSNKKEAEQSAAEQALEQLRAEKDKVE